MYVAPIDLSEAAKDAGVKLVIAAFAVGAVVTIKEGEGDAPAETFYSPYAVGQLTQQAMATTSASSITFSSLYTTTSR